MRFWSKNGHEFRCRGVGRDIFCSKWARAELYKFPIPNLSKSSNSIEIGRVCWCRKSKVFFTMRRKRAGVCPPRGLAVCTARRPYYNSLLQRPLLKYACDTARTAMPRRSNNGLLLLLSNFNVTSS